MTLVEQWRRIAAELPPDWTEARLAFLPAEDRQGARAAALLAPLGPARQDGRLLLSVARGGSPGPEQVRRLLAHLDEEGISGRLELRAALRDAEAPRQPLPPGESLAAAWERLLAALPADWSDLVCLIELASSDDLPSAALALAPLNPARHGTAPAFRFRVARRFGYGAAPQMARRCLARLDEEGIGGRLELLHALSASDPVATQGPVWHLAGRTL